MKNVRLIVIILAAVSVALLGLIGRCFYLQYCKNADFNKQSAKAQETIVPEKPCRGVIWDSQNRVLAGSVRIDTLFADRNKIEDIDTVSEQLSPILNRPAAEIAKLIAENPNPGYIKLQVGIDPNQREAFSALKPRPKGVSIDSDFKRYYPAGPLASHVVGFVDANNSGAAGIELQYEKILRGSKGSNTFYLDSGRRPIGIKEQKKIAQDGSGLVLTIDESIQEFARTELIKQWKEFQAESAVAIVMNPYTGAILAMVSLPDFDPSEVGKADVDTWRNRALTDPYEPGSIFKPIVASIALDGGAITKTMPINCENGSYSGKGFGTIGEYNHHRYGVLTVREILAYSSNIGMAKIGQKMGKTRLYTGLRLFGMGKLTGVDLPGEGSGVLWPMSKWTGYSITRIPYGQEISVTALQIARAYCTIANGGHMIKPHVLKSIVSPDGNVVEIAKHEPPTGSIIKPDVSKWLTTKALTAVITEEHGTGHNAALERWEVFGKTGTANIARANAKGFSDMDYVASFAGGAPADKPAVVVLVSIRKPNRRLGRGYTGGTVAAPVVREILSSTLTYMEQKGMIEPSKAPPENKNKKPHATPVVDTGGGF
jgi:cell division protein FtsI/penicillin-binding protein 2